MHLLKFFLSSLLIVPTLATADYDSKLVFVKDNVCIPDSNIAEESAAAIVLAAVVPKLIDMGVSLFSEKLRERAAEYEVTRSSKASLLWGSVDKDEEGVSIAFRTCLKAVLGGKSGAEVRFHFDYRSRPGNVFSVRPVYLKLGKNGTRGRSDKDLIVTLRLSVPKAVAGQVYNVEIAFPPFKGMEKDDELKLHATTVSSGWQDLPAISIAPDGSKYELPLTAEVSVVETDKGKGAGVYAVIADAIDESKSKVVEDLASSVIPPDDDDADSEESD